MMINGVAGESASHVSVAVDTCVCTCIVDVIAKKGIGNVTVDGLVEEITPTARGMSCSSNRIAVIISCVCYSLCTRFCEEGTIRTHPQILKLTCDLEEERMP